MLLKHEVTTVKSEAALLDSSDKQQLLESKAKIGELERMLKEKEKRATEYSRKSAELEDAVLKVKQSSTHRVNELNSHLKLLKKELEICQVQNSQYESMIKSQPHRMEKKSSMHSLLETSEFALEKVQKQFADEIAVMRRQLDSEKSLNRVLQQENEKIIRRVNKIQPFCAGIGGAAALLTVLVFGVWVAQLVAKSHS